MAHFMGQNEETQQNLSASSQCWSFWHGTAGIQPWKCLILLGCGIRAFLISFGFATIKIVGRCRNYRACILESDVGKKHRTLQQSGESNPYPSKMRLWIPEFLQLFLCCNVQPLCLMLSAFQKPPDLSSSQLSFAYCLYYVLMNHRVVISSMLRFWF